MPKSTNFRPGDICEDRSYIGRTGAVRKVLSIEDRSWGKEVTFLVTGLGRGGAKEQPVGTRSHISLGAFANWAQAVEGGAADARFRYSEDDIAACIDSLTSRAKTDGDLSTALDILRSVLGDRTRLTQAPASTGEPAAVDA